VNEMARVLRRHRSTIFRELRRNHFQDPCMPLVVGYFAMAAQLRTSDHCAHQRKLIRHPQLRDQVIERIKDGWTPEQIAGRMRMECAPLRVCQETIYHSIYAKEGLRGEL
jgi:IS30 family transposase